MAIIDRVLLLFSDLFLKFTKSYKAKENDGHLDICPDVTTVGENVNLQITLQYRIDPAPVLSVGNVFLL